MTAPLGDANVTATIAAAGRVNAGNWTAIFDPKTIGVHLADFECYHILVDGGPTNSACTVWINQRKYTTAYPGFSTEWDPKQPMKLRSGDTVYFYWNTGTGTAPDVWMYFQEPERL